MSQGFYRSRRCARVWGLGQQELGIIEQFSFALPLVTSIVSALAVPTEPTEQVSGGVKNLSALHCGGKSPSISTLGEK